MPQLTRDWTNCAMSSASIMSRRSSICGTGTLRVLRSANSDGTAGVCGMVWALENPKAGIVEADEMDYKRCLEVQLPYLGPVEGHYTDWTPLDGRPGLFPEDIDAKDPWQFRNILVR